MKVDLHIHTAFSDGTLVPEKVIDAAVNAELDVIALTDHDNVLSHKIAHEYIKANAVNIEVIDGVEINTIYKDYEIHILGYFMDTSDSDFQTLIKKQQEARIIQTHNIIDLLAKKAGIRIKYEDITNQVAPGGSIGRPHIAKAITLAGGTNSVIEAYNTYINNKSPVYVQRKTVTPHDAVEIIYDAGGIPVFAHPYDVDIAADITKELVNCGMRGIEVYHRKHSPAMIEYFSSIAEKYDLIITGGSDFHTPNPVNGTLSLGKNFVPPWVYDQLIGEKRRLELA